MARNFSSSLVNRDIPSMLNGVSQQPATFRLDSQCEEQVNMYPSLVDGLTSRPSTEMIGVAIPNTSQYAFNTSRDLGQRNNYSWRYTQEDNVFVHISQNTNPDAPIPNIYTLGFTELYQNEDGIPVGEDLRFNRYGSSGYSSLLNNEYGGLLKLGRTEQTSSGTFSYLSNVTDPATQVKMTTVQDYSFIVNKSATALMDTTVSTGTVGGTVQNFGDLGAGNLGTKYKVEGDPGNVFDNYYVIWEGSAYSETNAPDILTTLNDTTMPIWGDPAEWGWSSIDDTGGTTGGLWTDSLTWGTRETGDDDTNPLPSFIGRNINQIFLHKNRLGFIAGENIILSSSPAADFMYFKDSATALLDTDPIDVAATHTKPSVLYHAVSFDRSLLLFSDTNQFLLTGGDVLTPATATLDVTTEFACSRICEPVTAGNNVYFTADRGDFSILREYFVNADIATNDAADITAHVPAYIPKGVYKMTVSNLEDTLFAFTSEERDAIYVYKYYWKGDEKVQSSWSKWKLGNDANIVGGEVVDNYLYILVFREFTENISGSSNSNRVLCVERINLQPNAKDEGFDYSLALDAKRKVNGEYDADLDFWIPGHPITGFTSDNPPVPIESLNASPWLTSPNYHDRIDKGVGSTLYRIPDEFAKSGTKFTAILGNGFDNKNNYYEFTIGTPTADWNHQFGQYSFPDRDSGWYLIVPDDTTLNTLYMGLPYKSTYKFSEFFMKNDDGAPITDGRLMLKRMDINFTDTSQFKVNVTLKHRGTNTYEYKDALGIETTFNAVNKKDGHFTFPLLADSTEVTIELENDTPYPVNFQSASWTGLFHPRSSRS